MVAPRPIAAASLDDRYVAESGQVFLTGMQALVRLPIMQRQRDVAAGLNTGGYISGYRGSPLGGFDQALWQARKFIEQHHIVFQPGTNEDLAATALWGTQQIDVVPGAKYDGVFGMWYGKGPGVDRSGDVFKHANVNGTSKHGGVLALAGDDHLAKSSTVAHQSEFAFMDAMIPVINPAGIQDILDLGLHGFAMSRFSGCWIGFKIVTELADSSATALVDPHRVPIVLPTDIDLPPGGLSLRIPDDFQEQERRLHQFKLPAALAYWRANALDRVTVGGRGARLGIVTAGKAYLDVRQALDDLGIDDAEAQRLGLAVYKVGLTWPMEPQGLRRFADGLEQILVVEEKRPLMEPQVKDLLFNLPADRRPIVIGKSDEKGAPLLPVTGEILPARVAQIIAERLGVEHLPLPVSRKLELLTRRQAAQTRNAPGLTRPAYFCSGCPHNTSTRVPQGSLAMAGIGCHTMAMWMNRDTLSYTQMGGEGAPWVGLSHFTSTPHMFQNLGDGTYFHSGYLAIRHAVANKTRITYKVLYNDAVAMTGGQRHDGDLSPWKISRQVHAEGVQRIALVTDDPDKYPPGLDWAPGVTFHHRRDLDAVQRQLRDYDGVSVLIYDQTCAAEKRRRRKRGLYPDPARRVFINQAVCEGCGDCSVKSNCLSVVPVETEFGRKRAIDQSSCNKDYSCLEGFCPSFVTIEGGRVRKGKGDGKSRAAAGDDWPALPEPTLPAIADTAYGILITGIGGTGVVTIGALLGTAAHLDGYGASILDMIGMAQKGGAVMSHVRIARSPEAIHAVRLGAGGADLMLACDIAVASYPDALAKVEQGTTRAIVNTHETITGDFTRNPDLKFPGQLLRLSIEAAAGEAACDFLDAQALATALLGDSIATNLFMLGYAWQKGTLPVSAAALDRAIELNGAAVEMNRQAFLWGRRAAHDRAAVEKLVTPAAAVAPVPLSRTLDEIVAARVRHLTGYQDAAYARRYSALVDKVKAAEAARAPGASGLAEAVARGYAKLLAYKDEYEVARLYSDGAFLQQVRQQFEGDYKIIYHLAPPLIAERDARTGQLHKSAFGPHMMLAFGVLKRLKFLRGTRLDLFGRTAERRMERQLIADYEALIEEILGKLSAANHAIAVQLAALPDDIRGFGHVKDAHLAKVRARWASLLASFRAPAPLKQAAE